MQEILHLHDLHERGEQTGERQDLRERDERRWHQHAEIERERRGWDLTGEKGGVGVEGDRGEQQRERDHQHDREQDERVGRLIVREALRKGERGDAERAPERDEGEMSRGRFDTAVALDLKSE